jgi:hypothetical protein
MAMPERRNGRCLALPQAASTRPHLAAQVRLCRYGEASGTHTMTLVHRIMNSFRVSAGGLQTPLTALTGNIWVA